jgi:hypothetical protein
MSDTTKQVGVTVPNVRRIRKEMFGKLRSKVAEDNATLVERFDRIRKRLVGLEEWAIQYGVKPRQKDLCDRGIRMEVFGKLRASEAAEVNATLVERGNKLEKRLAALEEWARGRGYKIKQLDLFDDE